MANSNVTVFVSGCYDIIHAGHIQFFKEAKELGDKLIVSFASADVLKLAKNRLPTIPDSHKQVILSNIKYIDEVYPSSNLDSVLDFENTFRRIKPDILAVTEDDSNICVKQKLCNEVGTKLVVLEKSNFDNTIGISTSSIIKRLVTPAWRPLRVDFYGGWLDVPKFGMSAGEGYLCNMTITPGVTLTQWPYKHNAGLGGSAAYSLLCGNNAFATEAAAGVGWQDPAIISETGLCVWRTDLGKPVLKLKVPGDFLTGYLALFWTGNEHLTVEHINSKRDYKKMASLSLNLKEAIQSEDITKLAEFVQLSYDFQLEEGMNRLPIADGNIGKKYCGAGWGGYALYLFDSATARNIFVLQNNTEAIAIEPYMK